MRPYRHEWGTLSDWLRHALVLDLESPFRAADLRTMGAVAPNLGRCTFGERLKAARRIADSTQVDL